MKPRHWDARLWIGAVITSVFIISGTLGSYLPLISPNIISLRQRSERPSPQHLLGTDELGRDVLSRLIHGSRTSMLIGLVGTGVALLVGISLGAAAGFCRGVIDSLSMRFIDVLLSFPGILLAILVIAVLGTGTKSVIIAAGIFGIPSFARTARACTLSIKEKEYVEAARAIGASDIRIVVRHILINIASPMIVLVTLNIGSAILIASGLSFLGLGVQPPAPEWGAMLSEGRLYLRTNPLLTIIPGLVLFTVVLGFNLLGDGLRDALDPAAIR